MEQQTIDRIEIDGKKYLFKDSVATAKAEEIEAKFIEFATSTTESFEGFLKSAADKVEEVGISADTIKANITSETSKKFEEFKKETSSNLQNELYETKEEIKASVSYSPATHTNTGLMSSIDKIKLDGMDDESKRNIQFVLNEDGSFTETFSTGKTVDTNFSEDGSINQVITNGSEITNVKIVLTDDGFTRTIL